MAGIDSYTKFMYHMDGTHGSTTITDSSGNGYNGTCVGSSALTTLTVKFGTASAALNYEYITFPDDGDVWEFTDQPFTIDFWFLTTNSVGNKWLFSHTTYGSYWIHIFIDDVTDHVSYNAASGPSTWIFSTTGSHLISINTWYHCALVRNGSSWKGYINGEEDISNTSASALSTLAGTRCIGSWGIYYPLQGCVDELRVSKGIARWTAPFTPPTEAYSEDVITKRGIVNRTIVNRTNVSRNIVSGVNRSI